ncbi:MAG: LCP family protein [Eubacteriaceae bacterium]
MNNRKKNIITNKRSNQPKRKPTPATQDKKNNDQIPTTINKSKNLKKTKKRRPKVFKTLLILLLILFVSSFAVNAFFLKNVNQDLKGDYKRYGISDSAATFAKKHSLVNIAIFGVDGRDDVEGDRTDTIMVASADFDKGKIRVASLMRDSYVYVNKKYGFDKLNAAYAYGGSELALQTINQNFDMPITDYVVIDFTAVVTMVNAVGGISLDIKTDEELYWVNEYINDVNNVVNTNSPHLKNLGSQTVDGSQALAYCRVRYAGDGDFERTLRQRVVFEQVLSKGLNLSPMDQYKLLMDTLPYVKTSLTNLELIKYAINVGLMPSKEISQGRFPQDNYTALDIIDGVSYVIPNTLEDNIKALYWFVYDTAYTPSEKAKELSKEITNIYDNGTSYDDDSERNSDDLFNEETDF